jgi:uncharacterized protein YoxC
MDEFIIIAIITSITIQFVIFHKLKKHITMTAEEKLAEYVETLNVETTRIATLIEDLLAQVSAGTLDINELIAGLQPAVDGLKAVGVPPTA